MPPDPARIRCLRIQCTYLRLRSTMLWLQRIRASFRIPASSLCPRPPRSSGGASGFRDQHQSAFNAKLPESARNASGSGA
eukprot:6287533-Alexandrium_andersonii.AAC.1